MPEVKPDIETFAKIKVVGVGGSGGAAVDRMVKSGIRGVEFYAMNTDVQALHHNSAPHKIHIGKTVTRGLGAGMNPDMGKRSAEEAQNEIRDALKGSDMVFITCGLGGGTGSGAAPVIAGIAQELGALTVGVVTRPFAFEGPQRTRISEDAYNELAQNVDTIITIPNDRVLQIIDKKTSLLDSFKIVDDVLRQGVQGISELITVPGLINVDFADVKAIMENTGSALMGIGTGTGENRAVEAAQEAISSPLLELDIDGARGILLMITGGESLAMQEVAEAAKLITSSADDDVRVIFGAVVDESMGDDVRITVIATGFDDEDTPLIQSLDEDFEESFRRTSRPERTAPVFTKKPKFNPPPRPQPTPVEDMPAPKPAEPEPFTRRRVANPEPEAPEEDMMSGTAAMPEERPVQATQPAQNTAPQQSQQHSGDEEEDLEIPAFIRKKMGM